MKDNVCSIVFGGIGGQGILKAAEVCALAAMHAGHNVKKSEIHGMAQRGGSVESHVRFGKKVYSPLASSGGADFLVCFRRDEHARLKRFLNKNSMDLSVHIEKAKSLISNTRQLNMAFVGMLSKFLPISEKNWMLALQDTFAPSVFETNMEVFCRARSMELI